jgi:arylsulfatase
VRRCILVLAIALSCGATATCGGGRTARSVLLVTIDTLRADRLSSYGYVRGTTPHIDELLARGARFRWAFSTSPLTAPSHASILTGSYPSFHSVGVWNNRFRLEDRTVTLAEILSRAGMATAAVVSNPVLDRRLGLDQGFDHYDQRLPTAERNRPMYERVAEDTVDAALAAADRLAGRSFFLWVHFQDPHGPYTPPDSAAAGVDATPLPESPVLAVGHDSSGWGALPDYQRLGDERRLAAYERAYDAEIRYLDGQIGRLFGELGARGLLDETLVALTADHGEAFGEDGFYCAHGHAVGTDQTHVPLGFVGPGVRPGVVLERAVSNLDIFATVLDAAGVTDAATNQSRSLMDALRTGTEPDERIGFAESETQRAAFGAGNYVRDDRRPADDVRFWSERNPRTGTPRIPLGEPDWSVLGGGAGAGADRLLGELESFGRQADRSAAELALRQPAPPALTEEQLERLRSLGYAR